MKTKNTTTKGRGLSPVAQFFYDHAGYSYDPAKETAELGRRRCARSLADAEAKASELGFKYEWEQDDQTNREFTKKGPEYYLWRCACHDQTGKVVSSLCGVDFGNGGSPWGEPYARVVQAELASEALS